MRNLALLPIALLSTSPVLVRGQEAPVFKITPVESTIKFDVEASVSIKGTFDKWDTSLTFTSPDVSTGMLSITIDAASVDTGSGMKNGKLKGKDFFNVKERNHIQVDENCACRTGRV